MKVAGDLGPRHAYRIKEGDCLYRIAINHNCDSDTLVGGHTVCELNPG